MAEQTTYGQFLSCSTLYDFQNDSSNFHRINLKWNLDFSINLTQIELYRFIGSYMSCVNYNNIIESSTPKLIYTIKQKYNTDGTPSGSSVIENYFPWASQSIIESNIDGIPQEFTDDYNILVPTASELKSFHLLEDVDNKTIINDIAFTRRVLYYVLKVYIKGGNVVTTGGINTQIISNQGTYFVITDNQECKKSITSHSTKTQVRHDYLHYEGDEIWNAHVSHADSHWFQQIITDIAPMYGNNTLPSHKGSMGYGGRVWSGNRCSAAVYLHDLRDGYFRQQYIMPYPYNGEGDWNVGVGVHHSGYGLAIPGSTNGGSLKVYKLDPNSSEKSSFTTINSDLAPYIVNIPNYDNKIYISAKKDNNGILEVDDNLTRGTFTAPSIGGYTWGRPSAGPNNIVAIAGFKNSKNVCGFVNNNGDSVFVIPVSDYTGMNLKATQTCIDKHSIYPNTILNATINNFCLRFGNEFEIYTPSNITNNNDIIVNWSIPLSSTCDFNKPFSTINNNTFYDDFCGYDSENNLWKTLASSITQTVLGGNSTTKYFGRKSKIYRTSNEWDDGIHNENIFPFGGNSRYPTIDIGEQQVSDINTKEIEWFLTRNHGVSTYRYDKITTTDHLKLQEIDPSTLDKNILVTWTDPICGTITETAYNAWWRLIERNMLRVNLANTAPNTTSDYYTNWRDKLSYFNVYRTLNSKDSLARKWGIRLNVADIRNLQPIGKLTQGENLDDFYENFQNVWMPYILARITNWAEAFTSQANSYKNISEPTRTDIINNNKKGLLVHPFYQYAFNVNINNNYINENLSEVTKEKIRTYIKNLKYYPFGCPIIKTTGDIHMNNFEFSSQTTTGGITSSFIPAITPLYKSLIHPTPTIPIVTLLLSGYQSNQGYHDKYPYCYPWQNTLPSTMSNMHSAISGYNNFNVTYLVSTYTGSFLPTSCILYTDDFMPQYLTDIENTSAITSEFNTEYNTSNVYEKQIYFSYTYHSPSLNGLYYLPSGKSDICEYITPVNDKPLGYFIPRAEINVVNIYDYSFSGCQNITVSTCAQVGVLERWPEPRFYIDAIDDANFRKDMFCNNTWGGACSDSISLQTETRNCTAAQGYTTWGRYITSNGDVILSTGDWFLIDDSHYSTQLTQISTIFGTCTAYLWEGYESFIRNVSVTSNIPPISSYGPWISQGVSCVPPVISTYTTTTACSDGQSGYMTVSTMVSTTYYTHIPYYGDWSLINSDNCGKDYIACADTSCYTGSASYL